MKRFVSLSLIFLLLQSVFCFVSLSGGSVSAQVVGASSNRQEILNNVTIVEMKNQGLSETIIVAKIKSSKSSFDTSSTALQSLKKAGVSDLVILAMVQKASGMDITGSASNSPINTDLGGTTTSVAIPDGTEIKIVTAEEISGQKVAEGDPLSFKIEEDVKIDGKTVIAKDTLVRGTVASAKKKGFMGKGGELSVRIESTQTVDGQKLKLRAAKSDKGNDNLGSTVALTVLFGPLGLLRRGKEAKIKAGTVLTAYTDEVKTVLAR